MYNAVKKDIKKVAVVINPGSGNKKDTYKEFELTTAFNRHGIQPYFYDLVKIEETLFKNSSPDVDAIIVVGGDGTVRSVATYLVGKKIPLGIIPAGTFNHLAKDLKIPADLEDCLKSISKGNLATIDVAQVNGNYFFNNSSIGIYPKAVKHRKLYSWTYKWIAMTLASLNIFKAFPLLKVNYRFEDKDFEVITPLVFISNNRYSLDLMKLAERKRLDEGKLYLYVNHCRTRWQFIKLLINVLLHKKKKTAGLFEIKEVKECTLILKKPVIDVAMDGELMRLSTPLHYEMLSSQLTVITPEDSE